jgi:hypothetical protein
MIPNFLNQERSRTAFLCRVFVCLILLVSAQSAAAATLRTVPETGVYGVGQNFTMTVVLNTAGKPVNAADGALRFNPAELAVVGVSRGTSIFNLWTQEPTVSGGTISFGGGSPTGYTGSAGTVMTVTFRALAAGTPRVTFTSGSILAADGQGTNILTAMNGSSFTVSAPSSVPPPEVVPSPSTPLAPVINSDTHPREEWSQERTATLRWSIPAGVTALRYTLDQNPSSVPTETPINLIREFTASDLPDGISYFHLQFKNDDGWGRIARYRLAVDTTAPENFTIREATTTADAAVRTLEFVLTDVSPISRYTIKLNADEPRELSGGAATSSYTLPSLPPGRHVVVVEAYDSAGNRSVATYDFTITAFVAPEITEFPTQITEGQTPVIRGTTEAGASVTGRLTRSDGFSTEFSAIADTTGAFVLIPREPLSQGVYDFTAQSQRHAGGISEETTPRALSVTIPGIIRLGNWLVTALSLLVTSVVLALVLVLGSIASWYRIMRWRRRLAKETRDIEVSLTHELNDIVDHLHKNVEALRASRKSKLTAPEEKLIADIEADVADARRKIKSEIEDVSRLAKP